MTISLLSRTGLFGLCCFALLGCGGGGPGQGNISGAVSYKGEKIPMGRITFQSQVDRNDSFSGQILLGKYEVKGVTQGPTKITVETYGTEVASGAPKAPPKGLMIPPKDFEAMQSAKKLPIPEHYSDLNKSGLTFDIQRGDQTKDFDLK